jgi:hypothetical protein
LLNLGCSLLSQRFTLMLLYHESGEPTVCTMAFLWNLTHKDMGNVSMMSGISLTMLSRHL